MSKAIKNQAGFSLIEVVVSAAILAGLGLVILQSQINTTRMIYNLKSRDEIWDLINEKLQEIERQPKLPATVTDQKFPEDHPLYPATWSIITGDTKFLDIPMLKVSYQISWVKDGKKHTASDFILLDVNTSLGDVLKNIQLQ